MFLETEGGWHQTPTAMTEADGTGRRVIVALNSEDARIAKELALKLDECTSADDRLVPCFIIEPR